MPKKYNYDPECKKLAEYFIADAGNDPAGIPDLAQTIQDAVEDWLGHPGRAAHEASVLPQNQ